MLELNVRVTVAATGPWIKASLSCNAAKLVSTFGSILYFRSRARQRGPLAGDVSKSSFATSVLPCNHYAHPVSCSSLLLSRQEFRSFSPNFGARPSAHISPHCAIDTSCTGFSRTVLTNSTFLTTSMPSTTFPKTTCLPSKNGVGTVVMKN